MPEDVKDATGHARKAKPMKSGAISFDALPKVEAAYASIQCAHRDDRSCPGQSPGLTHEDRRARNRKGRAEEPHARHGIGAKRSKSGAVGFYVLPKVEVADASIQCAYRDDRSDTR